MKTTKFAKHLAFFFRTYLPDEKGCSPQTIDSYRYAFALYISYLEDVKNVNIRRIEFDHFTRDTVLDFLGYIQSRRYSDHPCSDSTRNARLAAFKSFASYLIYEFPEYMEEAQKILAIPMKKHHEPAISFLKEEGIKLLVSQIDTSSLNGYRDYVMIMLFCTTGIRVSELINIRLNDLSLDKPATVLIHGKGQKSRYVPLMAATVKHIDRYIRMTKMNGEKMLDRYLFTNHSGEKLTRQGINYIIRKYAGKARAINPELIPDDLSPHKLRHTAAMELLNSGVDLIYIRDLLGHESVTTTEVYAKTDSKLKRKAIEVASKELVPSEEAEWDDNEDLRNWLMSFGKAKK